MEHIAADRSNWDHSFVVGLIVIGQRTTEQLASGSGHFYVCASEGEPIRIRNSRI